MSTNINLDTIVWNQILIHQIKSVHYIITSNYLKYFVNNFYDISVSTMCIYRDYCVHHYNSTELVSLYTLDIGL